MGKGKQAKKRHRPRPATPGGATDDPTDEQPASNHELTNGQPKNAVVSQWSQAERWRTGLSVVALVVSLIAIGQPACVTLRSQRAYVLVETMRLNEPIVNDKPISVVVVLKNTGQTPAREIQTAYGMNIGQQPLAPIWTPPLVLSRTQVRHGDLGADQTRSLMINGEIPNFKIADVLSEKERLFVTLTVRYLDVFSVWGVPTRTTEACGMLRGAVFSPCDGYGRLD